MGAYEYQPPVAPNTNSPPQVNAGTDKIIRLHNWLDLSDASASDEQPLALTWTKTAGPQTGRVLFDPNNQTIHPRVWFSEPNQYTLQLAADDGELSAADTLAVTVVRVSAGRSQTIRLPNDQAMLDASIQGAALASVNWQVLPQYSDAGDVTFSPYDTSDYDTMAQFSAEGYYVLRLTAEFVGFEGISFTDDVSVNVLPDTDPDNNSAPAVSAWADPNTITWPVNTTYLYAQVWDDGLPDGRLSVQWKLGYSTTSGTATFGTYSAANPNTTVTLSQPGTYELILSADDGAKQTSRPVLVTVLPAGTPQDNQPPQASAGGNQNIHRSPFTPFTITQDASASDPTPTGYLSIQWTVIEGPQGGLGISDPTTEQPQITFFQTGTWTLLLTVSDGQYTATDQAIITVTTAPLESAFKITAGADKTITLPAFTQMEDAAVTFADSNEPYPLDELYIEWSKVSGPGEIEFFLPDDPNHAAPHTDLNPSLRFSKAGTYILQLFVSGPDSALLDEVQITVKTGTRISGGEDHSLIIDNYDRLWSAGLNCWGQLGWGIPGIISEEMDPNVYCFSQVNAGDQQPNIYLENIQSAAAGWTHSMALDNNHRVWAWGYNSAGQLGNGTREFSPEPVLVHTGMQESESGYLEDIVAIACGRSGTHSLAVDADGHVYSWGYNWSGQLGNNKHRRTDAETGYVDPIWVTVQNSEFETEPVLVGSPCTELDVYYTFEENTFINMVGQFYDTIFDISGNHHDGSLQCVQHFLTGGIVGSSMIFNENDEIILGKVPPSDPNYFGISDSQSRTISLWIRRLDGRNYPTGTLVAWGTDVQDGAAWEIKCIDGILGVYVSADNFDHKIQTVDPIEDDDNWHHVVILLPEEKTTLQDIQIWTGAEGQPIEQQDTVCLVQDPLEIQTGSELYAMIGDTWFDPEFFPDPDGLAYYGLIDELQIYSKSLTEKEIDDLHSDPDSVAPMRNIIAVSGGAYHSVALEKMDGNDDCQGRVYTFGDNTFKFAECYCGSQFECGGVYKKGKLGIGDDEDFLESLPVCVSGGEQGAEYLSGIVAVSAGWHHTMALEKIDPDNNYYGRVYTWGWNGKGWYNSCNNTGGRLGRRPGGGGGDYLDKSEMPILVYGVDLDQDGQHDSEEGYMENIIAISAGENHCMALDQDGHVWTWGDNDYGQLGNGTIECFNVQYLPKHVKGPDLNFDGKPDGLLGDHSPIIAIAAGYWHCLALDAEGTVWAWGVADRVGCGPHSIYLSYPHKVRYASSVCRISPAQGTQTWYANIQPAVDESVDGDEIVVYPGIYNEYVYINNKSLILRSLDPDNPEIVRKTIIDGCNIEKYQEEFRIDTVILIDKQGEEEPIGAQITISGFTVRNAQYGVWIKSYDPDMDIILSNNRIQNTDIGILSNYDGFGTNQIQLIIQGNIVEKNTSAGITVKSIESAILENNIIRANADGIVVFADQVLIKNNLICENGFMRNLSPVNCAGDLRIIGNTIANNYNEGFECQVPYNILAFRNNILWGNSGELHPSLRVYGFNCIEEKDHGDPNFANLYNNWAITQYDGTASMLSMSTNDSSKYNPGDVIEYHFDGIPCVISSVEDMGNRVEIHFSPSMEESSYGGRFVFNWGQPNVLITQTDAAGGENWMHVADANGFCIGDVIRYDVDNVRIVTGVNAAGGIVEFDPTLSGGTKSGVQVVNYSAYLDQMNLTHDYHLTNISLSCMDKGHPCDPNEGDTDLDGCARKLGECIDIGADEYSPYTVDAGADKEIHFGELANMADAEVLPDGCIFQWVLLSAPAGSAYPLNQTLTTYLNPIFELDALGQYLFQLSAYEDENLVGSDTVTVLVGMSVDADVAAPYEATLAYDPSSGLCSASVELVGQVRGADPEEIQVLWGDPDYAVSQDPIFWEQGDSLYTSKDITFYESGAYVIPLEVFDLWGRPLASDTAVVTIHAPAFEVDAGPARQIDWADPSVTIRLCGKVIGYPVGQVDLHWRQISGPRIVIFDPNLPGEFPRSGIIDPNVTFSLPGLYEFQFVADHGLERRVDDLQILVGSGVLLSAGEDLYGQLINDQADVTTEHAYVYPDDGSLTIQWYCNGQIVEDAVHPSGSFRFNTLGDYELTLKAWNAEQEWTDSILVHIYQLPSGDPGQSLYINPGTYEPVVLENGSAHLWLKDAFYHAQTGQVLSCRWSLSEGPDNVVFVQSPDDGQTSTALNPDVIFTEDGTYWLKLEVLDSQDTVVGSAQTCIVVLPEGTPPPTSGPDQTSPSVQLSALQDGEDITNRMLTHGRIDITARAVDSGSGLQILQLVLVNKEEEEEEEFLTEVFDQIHFPANLDLRHTLEVVGLSPGQYKLRAKAWDRIPNYGFAELVFDVNVPTADQPPIAAILNLDPNLIEEGTAYKYKQLPVIETGFFELHGLAWHPQISDQNVRYKLDLYGQSGQSNTSNDWNYVGPVRIAGKEWQVDGFYHGQVLPESDCFGDIDLTGFENGVYQLMLTVQVPGDYDWLTSYADAQFVLDCPLKIGQVRFTQEDLVIPVGGLPLRILRTYNSFQRHQDGPFGHGWSYTIAGMDIELNEQRIPMPLYDGYYNDDLYSIRTGDNFDRNVTLTLPDGQKATFQFYLEFDPGYMGQLGYYVAKYQSPLGVTDTLKTYPQEERLVASVSSEGLGAQWNGQGLNPDGSVSPEVYDFSGYRLTAADGTQYIFQRSDYGLSYSGELFGCTETALKWANPKGDLYLSQIISPSGEIIDFNVNSNNCQIGPEGIEHQFPGGAVTKAIKIVYDAKGRISEIYAPADQGAAIPTIYYEYDNFDNLAKVYKLVDKTKSDPNDRYETLTYLYEDEDQGYIPADHYITSIQDPRGLTPIQYIYDDSGRLIATRDVNGNTINITHNMAARTETVTDRSNNPTVYAYDERGNVLSVTDCTGVTATYTYDTESPYGPDRQTSVTVPHKSVNGVVTEYSTTTYAYTYNESGSLITQTSIDPNSNMTQSYFDTAGNITQIVHGKNAADPGTFEEVTTTRLFYNSKNLAYFTGITNGQGENLTWHSITLTWYDDINRLAATAQVNMDITSTVQSLLDGYGQAKPYAQMPSAQTLYNAGHPVTVYEYDSWSGSPDRPYAITDPSGQTQYFHYNENNAQDASWTVWDDPSNGQGADKFVMSLAVTDDQERPLRILRLTDVLGTSDPNVPNIYTDLQTYINDGRAVILGETYYNSIGQKDISINADGIVTKYEYDAAGQLVEILTYENWNAFETHYQDYPADLSGLLSISQTLYDMEGRAVVSVGPYDPTAGLPVGIETVYDDLGRVVQTRRWKDVEITLQDVVYEDVVIGRKAVSWKSEGLPPVEGNELSSSRTEYDIAGRIWRSYSQTEDGTEICTSEFVYDPSGRQIRSISLPDDAENRTETETIYDGTQQASVTDARGNLTGLIYDDLGRVTTTVLPAASYVYWDAQDQLQTASTAVYQHVGYDAVGRKSWNSSVTAQSDPEHTDSLSDLMHQKLRAKTFGYDAAGRMDYVELPQLDTQENPAYRYFYDPAGNLVGILDAENRLTVFEYDEQGRQTHKYIPFEYTGTLDDYTDIYALDLGEIDYEQTSYDAFGRVELQYDYKGQAVAYFYNSLGQLEYKRYYETGDYPTTVAEEIHYTCDNLGRQDVIYKDSIAQEDCDYDIEGNIIRITSPQGIINYNYSPVTGRKVRMWTGNVFETADSVVDYAYDDLGRLWLVTVIKRNGQPLTTPEETEYSYDENGNRHAVTLANGVYTEYTYDTLNRLTNVSHYEDETKTDEISHFGYQLYADGSRAVANESLNEERDTVYQYDVLNRLVQEDSYTAAGHGYTAWYTYDLVGNRQTRTVEVTNAADTYTLETIYTYDPNTDRLLTESHSEPIAALPYGEKQHIYAYASPGGRIDYQIPGQRERIGQFRAFWIGLPSIWNSVFFYALMAIIPLAFFGPLFGKRRNPLDAPDLKPWHRMLCVLFIYIFLIGPEVFQTLSQAAIQFSQLSMASWGSENRTVEYEYDANGSTTKKTTSQTLPAETLEVVDYVYNLQNRLASVTTTTYSGGFPVGSTTTEYLYNAEGIRVRQVVDDTYKTDYFVDPANPTGYAQVLQETEFDISTPSSPVPLNRTEYTVGDDVLSQTKSAWSGLAWSALPTQYLLYDGHGSTRQLVNSDLSVQDSYSYDGYGVMLSSGSGAQAASSAQTKLLYCGEQYDKSLDQYYLRARYYNQNNGLFNRVDPYSGNLQDPQSLHKYLYCHANPINSIDPSGCFNLPELLIVSFLVGFICMVITDIVGQALGWSREKINKYSKIAFWIGFLATAFVYSLIWTIHSIWLWLYGGGQVASNPEVQTQLHHFASDKHSYWTPRFQEIANKFNLSLDDPWNLGEFANHVGRHSELYHQWVYEQMSRAANEAGTSFVQFIILYHKYVVAPVMENPEMMYSEYWQ